MIMKMNERNQKICEEKLIWKEIICYVKITVNLFRIWKIPVKTRWCHHTLYIQDKFSVDSALTRKKDFIVYQTYEWSRFIHLFLQDWLKQRTQIHLQHCYLVWILIIFLKVDNTLLCNFFIYQEKCKWKREKWIKKINKTSKRPFFSLITTIFTVYWKRNLMSASNEKKNH